MSEGPDRQSIGLPFRPFLFTLDQLAGMVELSDEHFRRTMVHFEGRNVGARKADRLLARNIAPPGERPEWRVAEAEVVRWCRVRHFRLSPRGWIKD